jgi:uncharacterized membrane protein YbaN (DUF454 family)
MRTVFVTLAGLFVALATLGVFLPVLPTTPFLLLASACLVRSSPRLHARLLASPLFGPLLLDWEHQRGVRLHVKVTALAVLVSATAWSCLGTELVWGWKLLVLALASIGATVILRLRTIRMPLPLAQERRDPDDSDERAA